LLDQIQTRKSLVQWSAFIISCSV